MNDLHPLLSVITPAFNEQDNLPLLHERLKVALEGLEITWEWIVIDDHSRDATFDVVRSLTVRDSRVRGVRFARNSGSHAAIGYGVQLARGRCAAILAADLQDPPEALPQLLAKWRAGAHVVWAVREQRQGEKASTLAFARFYYWIMRRIVGLHEIPASGADFLLIDRRVMDALRKFGESNVSLLALVTWMGFRQEQILYTKQARVHGSSGWSLEKKLKLLIDSVTSFTYLPIRLMIYVGFIVAVLGFTYAAFIVVHAAAGKPVEGWSSLMIVVLVLGGFQMLLMGVLGEYLWRVLDESRRRPRYLVEDSTHADDSDA